MRLKGLLQLRVLIVIWRITTIQFVCLHSTYQKPKASQLIFFAASDDDEDTQLTLWW